LLTVAGECDDDEDDDGHWWWQSEAGKPEKWKGPQWEVLAANRVGWEAGLKKVIKWTRETSVSERQLASWTFVERRCERSGSPGYASTRPSARKRKRET
jgi:hypothetical protein